MNDAINIRMLFEDLVKGGFIGNVDIVELRLLAANEFNAIQNFWGGIVKIVRYHNFVVRFEKREGSEGPNVAGTTVCLYQRGRRSKDDETNPVTRTEPTAIVAGPPEVDCLHSRPPN